MTFTHALSTNNYGPAKFVVSATAALGTHTTIAAALAVASSGDDVFVRDGTYTENLTIPAGVSLVGFTGDGLTPTVTIIGNITMTAAGTSTISHIRLQTNSAALITVSGSNACTLNILQCFINCTNNTGITFSNSNAASKILINNSYGNIGTTGIALFSHSSAGNLNIQYSNISNSGGSSTANTVSAGTLNTFYSSLTNPTTTSSTGGIGLELSDINTAAQNVTSLTVNGSGTSSFQNLNITSGSASAISVGSGATLGTSQLTINSTNTNAITGAGTIVINGIFFTGTSKTINVTAQTGGTITGLTNISPSAGYLGERITATGTGGTPANNTPTTLATIALTPGVWDVSCIAAFTFTGLSTIVLANISTTTNTIVGTLGDAYAQEVYTSATGVVKSLAVPAFRVAITANTNYFLVVQNNFSTGAVSVNGRISGVRVG